jgi:NmrA-like family
MLPLVKNGTLPQPLSPDTKLQQLSEEDYGKMVAEVFVGVASPLENRPADFANRAIEVASVEMTMPEIAAAFSHVLGKKDDHARDCGGIQPRFRQES